MTECAENVNDNCYKDNTRIIRWRMNIPKYVEKCMNYPEHYLNAEELEELQLSGKILKSLLENQSENTIDACEANQSFEKTRPPVLFLPTNEIKRENPRMIAKSSFNFFSDSNHFDTKQQGTMNFTNVTGKYDNCASVSHTNIREIDLINSGSSYLVNEKISPLSNHAPQSNAMGSEYLSTRPVDIFCYENIDAASARYEGAGYEDKCIS